MANENIEFIENKIKEVKTLLFSFNTLHGSLETRTYSTTFDLIRENKDDHEFYSHYIDRGFKEFFGVASLRTPNYFYFSCEIPNGKALFIKVELKN